MEAVGQTESLDYLIAAAQAGKLPVTEVIEEKEPDGETGRLVRLTCGDTSVLVREVVASFEDEKFDYQEFWRAPIAAVANY